MQSNEIKTQVFQVTIIDRTECTEEMLLEYITDPESDSWWESELAGESVTIEKLD